eukprot:Nk52_evm29s2579 gene=Nk52_evmTU29s2579
MSVSGCIKYVVRVLDALGVDVGAAVFRGGRHNEGGDGREGEALWQGLHRVIVLHQTGILAQVCRHDTTLPSLWTALAQLDLGRDFIASYVKFYMSRYGYRSTRFYGMTPQHCSSRELLIAFGWLMGETNLFGLYKFKLLCQVERSVVVPLETLELPEGDVREIVEEMSRVVQGAGEKGDGGFEEAFTRMCVILTKLNHALRGIYQAQLDMHSLENDIRVATMDPLLAHPSTMGIHYRSHLSVPEVLLAKYPDFLAKVVEKLGDGIERLREISSYAALEGLFWKWLQDVVKDHAASQTKGVGWEGVGDTGLMWRKQRRVPRASDGSVAPEKPIELRKDIDGDIVRMCKRFSKELDKLFQSNSAIHGSPDELKESVGKMKNIFGNVDFDKLELEIQGQFPTVDTVYDRIIERWFAENSSWSTSSGPRHLPEGLEPPQLCWSLHDGKKEHRASRIKKDAFLTSECQRLQRLQSELRATIDSQVQHLLQSEESTHPN